MNKLCRNNSDDTFIDENGKKWHKIHSKDYVVMTDDEPLVGHCNSVFHGRTRVV